MATLRSLTAFVFATLIFNATARYAPAHKIHQAHKHEARDLGKRQVGPPYQPAPRQAVPTTSAPGDVLTYITPSPGAKPIAVTEQSQYVTSFEPQYTLCELPPLAFFSASPVRPSTAASTAPYRNYSISIPEGNGTCTTIYKPTQTMVCATTLTGLFDKWTVSKCDQELTFSTQYGFVLATPTPSPAGAASSPIASATSAAAGNGTFPPILNGTNAKLQSVALVPRQASLDDPAATTVDDASIISADVPTAAPDDPTITPGPSIETLTTYYLAPWQELTAGTVPSDIDLKVCRTFPNGTEKCVREYESWHTTLATKTTSTVTSVNISTTIHGASQIIVETYVANVTEMLTTFSMDTTFDVGFLTEIETTHVTTRAPTTTPEDATVTSTSPTVYTTKTVEEASETGVPSSSDGEDVTSTVTIRRTSTITTATITTTVPAPSAAAPSAEPEAEVSAVPGVGDPAASTAAADQALPSSTDWAGMLGIGGPGGKRRRRA